MLYKEICELYYNLFSYFIYFLQNLVYSLEKILNMSRRFLNCKAVYENKWEKGLKILGLLYFRGFF